MKFKYLKLTLLMASLIIVPAAMNADAGVESAEVQNQANLQADVEGAAKLLLELTDPSGAQRTIHQTIEVVDQIILKLESEPAYKETCDALHEFKNVLVNFEKKEAEGVLGRVTAQVKDMYQSLSEGMKAQLNARLEQLKKLKDFQKAKLLSRLGVSFPLWGKR